MVKCFSSHPGGGVGTGTGRIKIGDGTTAYTSLPYFINPDNFISNISTANVTFTETSETNNTTLLSRIITGAGLNTIIASIKNLLSNLNGSVTTINNDISQMQINFQDGVDSIYDACVAKGSTPASTALSDVVAGIMAIPTGITPTGTISITSNGTKDVSQYASANVNVPNSNSGTYTYPSGSTGGKVDLGATNSYRYVVATNVYNKGKADGASGKYTPQFTYVGNAAGTWNAWRYDNLFSFSAVNGGIYALAMGGTNANSTGLSGSGFTQLGWWRNANAGLALFKATSTSVKVGRNGDWPYNNNGFVLIRIG